MGFLFSRSGLLVLVSAVVCALAIMTAQFYLAWCCLVPFFMVLQARKGKKAFATGAWFGFAFCAVLLYWMAPLIADFSGSLFWGIMVYIIALMLALLYFSLLSWSMAWFTRSTRPAWLNAISAAAVWTVGEWIFSTALPGMPWFGLFRIGNALLGNLYAIQPAELGGAFLLSFWVVLVNHLLAHYLSQKQWKMLALPLGLLMAYLLGGYGLLSHFQQQYPASGKPVPVAILCDNTPPDVKWNETNGNVLIQRLLDLSNKAATAGPGIALWTESVVPWTYRPDDDFIKEVLRRTASSGMTHIMGLTTDHSATEIYNSAYCLLPDGKVAGRYDKHYPVSLAERPLGFLSLPFSGSIRARFAEKEGTSPLPLSTPYGKAGALVCNDGTVPGSTVQAVRHGATFLVSLSNDAWFSHVPSLVLQHFLNTRLRAVEVRKDMAINCNRGTSGKVSATGELQLAAPADDSFVMPVSLDANKHLTAYTAAPLWFVVANITFLFILVFIPVYSKKSSTK